MIGSKARHRHSLAPLLSKEYGLVSMEIGHFCPFSASRMKASGCGRNRTCQILINVNATSEEPPSPQTSIIILCYQLHVVVAICLSLTSLKPGLELAKLNCICDFIKANFFPPMQETQAFCFLWVGVNLQLL